jgi:hypothetical protein
VHVYNQWAEFYEQPGLVKAGEINTLRLK